MVAAIRVRFMRSCMIPGNGFLQSGLGHGKQEVFRKLGQVRLACDRGGYRLGGKIPQIRGRGASHVPYGETSGEADILPGNVDGPDRPE